jgi:hypothetical protein
MQRRLRATGGFGVGSRLLRALPGARSRRVPRRQAHHEKGLQDREEEGSWKDEEGPRLPQREGYRGSHSHQNDRPHGNTHRQADQNANCDSDQDTNRHVYLDSSRHRDEHFSSVSNKYIQSGSRVASGSYFRHPDRDCYSQRRHSSGESADTDGNRAVTSQSD